MLHSYCNLLSFMSCILKKAHLFVWKCINYALIFIGTFGSITAATYSLSGEINWPVAILFVLGGIIGGCMGQKYHQKYPKIY
jgi:uncharacterized membrane protein YfcA